MTKYYYIFKIYLIESLQYKAHGLIYTTFDLIPPLISMFYWNLAFQTQPIIQGFTQIELITYLLLTGVVRTLIVSYPEHDMIRLINRGDLNNYLTKPLSLIKHQFLGEIAFKFNRAIFTIPSYILLAWLALHLTGQLPQLSITLPILTLFFLSFLLAYLIKYIIGLAAIWTSEVNWLTSFNELVMLVLSGSLLPLEFFPDWFQSISAYLPFQYLNYIPVLALQGQVTTQQTLSHITIQIIWIIILLLITQLIWNRGLKKYTAYGG